MSADDSLLSQGTVDFREEERRARNLQLPACDRCTLGVMDATNSHYLGLCSCPCHNDPETYADEHECGQFRIAAPGEQRSLLPLPDETIPTSEQAASYPGLPFDQCRCVLPETGRP